MGAWVMNLNPMEAPWETRGVDDSKFTVLGPLMGGKGSQAFLGCVKDDRPRSRSGQVRPVVMVFLPEPLVKDAELLAQVIEETRVASEIDHVNVIGVWGVARLEEGTARVVEFADAESLWTVYERLHETARELPVEIAAALVKDACMGAHYAHELGRMETGTPMIHGGLRPGTLLVSFQGMAKVTGYGAATLAEWLRKGRGEEAAVRDPYTAPEQIFGGRTAATEQTDVYGLGAVLFEALTGKPPIDEGAGISDALIRDDVTPEMLDGVDPRLVDIVVRAMRRKATDRFISALDMRHALLDTDLCASDAEVRSFMEELFPPDYPTRVARMNLLASARKPREKTSPQFKAPPVPGKPRPSDSVVEPALHPDFASPAADAEPPESEASEPQEPPPAAATPPTPAAPPAPAKAAPPPAAPAPAAAPTPPAQPTPAAPAASVPPGMSSEILAPAAPPPPPAPSVVVYRTPPWVIITVAVLVGTAVAFGLLIALRPDSQVVVAPTPTPAPEPTPAPVPEEPPPPEATPAPTSTQPKPKPKPTSTQPKPKPKPKPPPKPKKGTLKVTTIPPVNITIDGKSVGKGSGQLVVKSGKHRVKLRDSSKGINLSRTVRVRGGETKSVEFEIGQGKLLLTAPAGAIVILDGRKIGTAPLKPYPVYEGSHKVTVKKAGGGPKFSRNFSVRPGDEVSVWVEFRTVQQ